MRLIQFRRPDGTRAVGRVIGDSVIGDSVTGDDRVIDITAGHPEIDGTLRLLHRWNEGGVTAEAWAARHAEFFATAPRLSWDQVDLLLPLDRPDNPWALQLWGAGITHRRSADAREEEARAASGDRASIYDRLYRAGVVGGRPVAGQAGSKPEIFFKANGHQVAGPGQPLEAAASARRLEPEPELVAYFIAGASGRPKLVGFSGGNDFSDQGWESENPLYLGHAKVQDRLAALGPVLVTPDDPNFDILEVTLRCRVFRGAQTLLDSGRLATGERHMAHSLANLTWHLFDHRRLLPDEVRALYLGTSAVFEQPVRPGDRIEIRYDSGLGTLVNPVVEA